MDMKRWILTIEGFETRPLIYAETEDEAKKYFKTENITDIELYSDTSYLSFIEKIKEKAELLESQENHNKNQVREWYVYYLQEGTLKIILSKNLTDDLYYDIVRYQFRNNNTKVEPVTFNLSDPEKLYNLFFEFSPCCEVYSYRIYGQPRLPKPAELKGIKQSFSVDFMSDKCKCQCFINENDLWIKHRDFFSSCHKADQEDIGTPLTYRLSKYFCEDKQYLNKFVYPDCWGEIVLRNEAWIVFRDFKNLVDRNEYKQGFSTNMIKLLSESSFCKEYLISQSDLGLDWENFFKKTFDMYKNCFGKF